jgi:hypothetical protein
MNIVDKVDFIITKRRGRSTNISKRTGVVTKLTDSHVGIKYRGQQYICKLENVKETK